MVHLTPKKGEPPDQTLWSNSKDLVEKQQALFNRLWNMAIPVTLRKKELEKDNTRKQKKIIDNYNELVNEINILIEQSEKELLIFSSVKLLNSYIDKNNFLDQFLILQKRGVSIKILTDNMNEYLMKKIYEINREIESNSIEIGHSNKLGDFDEMVIIVDSKYSIQINISQNERVSAILSNEEHLVLVQEILFEKYWNEVKSLIAMNN